MKYYLLKSKIDINNQNRNPLIGSGYFKLLPPN
jgi:hypothetical protein